MKKRSFLLLSLLFTLLAINPTLAARDGGSGAAEIDVFIENYMKRNRIPGVALAFSPMVTVIGPALAGRGFDLRWFMGFYPDVALLAGTALMGETIQAGVKIYYVLTDKSALAPKMLETPQAT